MVEGYDLGAFGVDEEGGGGVVGGRVWGGLSDERYLIFLALGRLVVKSYKLRAPCVQAWLFYCLCGCCR